MNDVVTQLIPVFIQSKNEAKHILTDAILHAVPGVYSSAFGMIVSGNLSHIITGFTMIAGLTALIMGGIWKLLVNPLARDVLSLSLRMLSSVIGRHPR